MNRYMTNNEEIVTKIAESIDYTAVKPDVTIERIEEICNQALEYKFPAVCVLPYYVGLVSQLLYNTPVKTCTVIGFPIGATYTSTKIFEAGKALEDGAQELDMVMNIAAFLNNQIELVRKDIELVVNLAHQKGAIVKVIIETCLLKNNQKLQAGRLIVDSGADFIKTSTGFSFAGATIKDVILLRKHFGKLIKIKASGNIKTAKAAWDLIDVGASRIGTSSAVEIINEAKYYNFEQREVY